MMGIPESEYRFVFDHTNIILGAADPEYVADLSRCDAGDLQRRRGAGGS